MVINVFTHFSYWIFIWFLLYYFRIVHSNPKWWLVLAFIQNIIVIFLLIRYKYSLKFILIFGLIAVLVKVIPFMLIKDTKVHNTDFVWYFIIFGMYCLGMYLNNKNTMNYIFPFDSIKNKKFFPPILREIFNIDS